MNPPSEEAAGAGAAAAEASAPTPSTPPPPPAAAAAAAEGAAAAEALLALASKALKALAAAAAIAFGWYTLKAQRKEADLAFRRLPANLIKQAAELLATTRWKPGFGSFGVPRQEASALREVCFIIIGKYLLEFGPRGSGKTFLAFQAVSAPGATVSHPGVIMLSVGLGVSAPQAFFGKFAVGDTKSAMTDLGVGVNQDFDNVEEVCKAATAAFRKANPEPEYEKWVPTIIIDLDRNLTEFDIRQACRFAKAIAVERRAAAVILVMSDASMRGVPLDEARQVGVLGS